MRRRTHQFLRRFLQHILPSDFQRVRHGGFYSAAAKEKYSHLAALLGHRPPPPAEPWQMHCEECGGVLQVAEICQHPPVLPFGQRCALAVSLRSAASDTS